ncbi:MAG: proprotein convertase P-domain-containing protein [Planctomycetota bacterium]
MITLSIRAGAIAAAVLSVAGGTALAGPQNATQSASELLLKQFMEASSKDPTSLAARRSLTDYVYNQTRGADDVIRDRVIYGDDDRIEVYEETDPILRQMSEAACVVIERSEVTDNGDGTYTLLSSPWTSTFLGALCTDEPFYGQPAIGNCSGWFVGQDIIVTAGHCIDSGDIGTWGYLFNFEYETMGAADPVIVPAEDVYWITEIVDRELGGGADHCITRVDRNVTGRAPVRIERDEAPPVGTPLTVIGHPATIIKKIAGGAEVKSINSPTTYADANLDTYGGNSGSMVIRTDTYKVTGILVRGATDYVNSGGCIVSNRLSDTGRTDYEEISLTTRFDEFIPEVGLVTTPGGATHIGVVGGPFTDDPTAYTIDNPTDAALSYTVTITDDANGMLLLDGGTSQLSGSVPAMGNAGFVVSLAPSAASLPAGVYTASVTVSDPTNGVDSVLTHTVEVGQSIVTIGPGVGLETGGPVGGPFPGSIDYTLTNQRPTPTTVQVTASDPWISVNGGQSATVSLRANGASNTVTLAIDPSASSLAAGLYNGSITFLNTVSGTSESRDVSLDVGRFVFSDLGGSEPIADNSTITRDITVSEAFCVGDVDVDVDIAHSYQGDLRVILTAPDGTSITLHDRSGGGADDLMLRYDDDGSGTPADGPGALADFEGAGSQGLWTLTVSDNAGGDTGTFNGWSLRLASSGDTCPPEAFAVNSSGLGNTVQAIALDGLSPTGGFLRYFVTSLPAHGSLWDAAGNPINAVPHELPGPFRGTAETVYYRPAPSFAGADSFGYKVNDGQDSPDAAVSIAVGGDAPFEVFDMNTDPGWTADTGWEYGQPQGNDGDPSTGYTGLNVYGYNLAGDYQSGMPERFLTTTAIDCSGKTNVRLRFARQLGVEHSTYDNAKLLISSDGTSYSELWANLSGFANTINETEWSVHEYDISAFADGQSTVYLRWQMGATDGSVQYHGWNIDDVELIADAPAAFISDLTTSNSNPGDADYGQPDGEVNTADLTYLVEQWLAGTPIADMTTDNANPGDTDYGQPDASITTSDLTFFVEQWLAGA